MATIQIRGIPDEAYETLRKLARAEGKSLQSYMRDQLIELARQAEKVAAFAALEQVLEAHPPKGITTQTILDAIDEARYGRFGR